MTNDEIPNDERVLELARAIRPYLQALFADRAAAEDTDRQLAVLLAEARTGGKVDGRILDKLRQPATQSWAAEFLARGYPAELTVQGRGFNGLPGTVEEILAAKLVCPEGDYTLFRRVVGQVERCPSHQLELVAAAGR